MNKNIAQINQRFLDHPESEGDPTGDLDVFMSVVDHRERFAREEFCEAAERMAERLLAEAKRVKEGKIPSALGITQVMGSTVDAAAGALHEIVKVRETAIKCILGGPTDD